VTAAALMIGLALVTFVTVFAAGIRGSIDRAIDRSFHGDLTFQHTDGFSPIPAAAGREVSRLPGVQTVSGVRFSEAKTGGDRGFVTAVDPRHVRQVLDIDWDKGSDATLSSLGPREVVMDSNWGEDNGVDVGDRIHVLTREGKRVDYVVRGSLEDVADLYGNYVMTYDTLERDFGERRDGLAIVKFAPGADKRALRKRVERLIAARYPVVKVFDQKELKERQAEQVNQLLGLLYALLSLAVVVSLFGIVNTLTLSIYERTRELGLLRAIGMSRLQVRRAVRYESVITALIGALLGSALGVLFAVIVSRPLAEEGFSLSIPVGKLILLMVLAALAGVVAAILPARRASRLDVLEALAYE
jgi:putative ABC transport system permease protein